ncbi:MAG: hypothetical protein PHV23_04610 [Candidatus Gracilibacteria bacterium]|nr:hypothetical protein [Candidatus Gracilibacteria bacterium]
MNYEALKLLIKSLVGNFRCVTCSGSIEEKDIFLMSIEGQKIVLEVLCPSCSKKSIIKSEVMSVDLTKSSLSKEQIVMLKNTIENNNGLKIRNSQNTINDNLIVELNKDLKKEKLNVMDLFNND